jgi:hypothetical protein
VGVGALRVCNRCDSALHASVHEPGKNLADVRVAVARLKERGELEHWLLPRLWQSLRLERRIGGSSGGGGDGSSHGGNGGGGAAAAEAPAEQEAAEGEGATASDASAIDSDVVEALRVIMQHSRVMWPLGEDGVSFVPALLPKEVPAAGIWGALPPDQLQLGRRYHFARAGAVPAGFCAEVLVGCGKCAAVHPAMKAGAVWHSGCVLSVVRVADADGDARSETVHVRVRADPAAASLHIEARVPCREGGRVAEPDQIWELVFGPLDTMVRECLRRWPGLDDGLQIMLRCPFCAGGEGAAAGELGEATTAFGSKVHPCPKPGASHAIRTNWHLVCVSDRAAGRGAAAAAGPPLTVEAGLQHPFGAGWHALDDKGCFGFSEQLCDELEWRRDGVDHEGKSLRYADVRTNGAQSGSLWLELRRYFGLSLTPHTVPAFRPTPPSYLFTRAVAVDNDSLRAKLGVKLRDLAQRRGDGAAGVFNRQWEDDGEKAGVYARMSGLVLRRENKAKVLLMWHGCSEFAAASICRGGVADLRLTDGGYFGSGVYLTPQAAYACDYASGANVDGGPYPSNERGEWVLLLCAVVVGNVYPISRRTDYDRPNDRSNLSVSDFHCAHPVATAADLKKRDDKALKSGFDAHWIAIDRRDLKGQCAVPSAAPDGAVRPEADELVVKEEAQVLPLLKVYFTKRELAAPELLAALAAEQAKAEAAAERAMLGRVQSERPGEASGGGGGGTAAAAALDSPIARAKRCVVQIAVVERASGRLVDCGSGALIGGGRILSAAHVFDALLWETPGQHAVLIGTYEGDMSPSRWRFVAQLATPLAMLRDDPACDLDFAVLHISGAAERVVPSVFSGADPGVTTYRLEVEGAVDDGAIAVLPCLRCDPAFRIRAGEHRVTLLGFPAKVGQHLFADSASVATVQDGFLRTSAYIESGSSGGPAINEAGDVVAVVSRGGGLATAAPTAPIGRVVRTAPQRAVEPGVVVESTGEVVDAVRAPKLSYAQLVSLLTEAHFGAAAQPPAPPAPPAANAVPGSSGGGGGGGGATAPASFTAQQVTQWLDETFVENASFAEQLPSYKTAFVASDVNGETLCGLAKEDLQELGIDRAIHRTQLFNQWQALVRSASSSSSS